MTKKPRILAFAGSLREHALSKRVLKTAIKGAERARAEVTNWLRGNLQFVRAQRYFAGSVYIGLGAATAFSGAHKK